MQIQPKIYHCPWCGYRGLYASGVKLHSALAHPGKPVPSVKEVMG